jgi:hypothetical protein
LEIFISVLGLEHKLPHNIGFDIEKFASLLLRGQRIAETAGVGGSISGTSFLKIFISALGLAHRLPHNMGFDYLKNFCCQIEKLTTSFSRGQRVRETTEFPGSISGTSFLEIFGSRRGSIQSREDN